MTPRRPDLRGHASPEELEFVSSLAAAVAAEVPVERILDLVVVLNEPAHAEPTALKLCDFVLALQPTNARAAVWYAYLAIHHLMHSEALEGAVALLLESACRDASTAGAAYMLLDEALTDLGRDVLSERIERLEASIRAEPSWSENHRRLARAYHEAGRREEAERHLEAAIANLLDERPADLVDASTHECLTGRLTVRSYFDEELRLIRS